MPESGIREHDRSRPPGARFRDDSRNLFHVSIRKAIAACVLCIPAIGGHGGEPRGCLSAFRMRKARRRYRALVNEFRCPKCLNVNISGSDAPIAQ